MNHNLSPQSLQWPLMLGLLILIGLLSGCAADDASAKTRLFFAHQLNESGPIEVLVNGDSIGRVASNQVTTSTDAVVLSTGEYTLSLLNDGASAEFLSDVYTFEAQSYLIAFSNDLAGDGQPRLQQFGQGLPTAVTAGSSLVQVVNLLSERAALDQDRAGVNVDVYVNSALIATNIGHGTASTPLEIAALSGSTVQVFRTGATPGTDLPLLTLDDEPNEQVNLLDGSRIVMILSNSNPGVGEDLRLDLQAFGLE